MIVGPASQLPPKPAVRFADYDVVDAGVTRPHQSQLVELPVLVAVRTEPVAGIVTPFVGKPHRDARAFEGPHLFDQAVFDFPGPFALQEFDDGGPAGEEFRAIAPRTVDGVCERHALRITRVPRVFGGPRLLCRRLARERRKRRASLPWRVHQNFWLKRRPIMRGRVVTP